MFVSVFIVILTALSVVIDLIHTGGIFDTHYIQLHTLNILVDQIQCDYNY